MCELENHALCTVHVVHSCWPTGHMSEFRAQKFCDMLPLAQLTTSYGTQLWSLFAVLKSALASKDSLVGERVHGVHVTLPFLHLGYLGMKKFDASKMGIIFFA